MNPFEHVGVLYSFIVSLGLAQVMTTVGALVQARRRVRFSCLFAIWLLIALLSHLNLWLQLWEYRQIRSWSVGAIFVLLGWAGAVFMMTTLIQPRVRDGEPVDLPAFHAEQRQGYILAFVAAFVISLGADALIEGGRLPRDELILNAVAGAVVMLPFSALAFFSARPWAQWTGALGTLAMAALSFALIGSLDQT